MALTNEQLNALRSFADWLRAKNDKTQEELEREEASRDE